MKKILTSKLFWALFILALFISGGIFFRKNAPITPEYSSVPVEEKELIQSVEETGTVKSEEEISYGWETSGRVIEIQKNVGDIVKEGDIIALLDTSNEVFALKQAQAGLAAAQAQLNLKIAGATQESITQAQASLKRAEAGLAQTRSDFEKVQVSTNNAIKTAQSAVDTAQNNLKKENDSSESQIVKDAYEDLVTTIKPLITTFNAVLRETDQLVAVDDANANNAFRQQLGAKKTGSYYAARQSFEATRDDIDQYAPSILALKVNDPPEKIDTAVSSVLEIIDTLSSHLYDVEVMLNNTITGNNLSASALETFKTEIATQQTNVNTAQANVINALQTVNTAKNSLKGNQIVYDKAVEDLKNVQAEAKANINAAQSSVNIQEAAVLEAQANLDALLAPPRTVDIASLRADVARNVAIVEERQQALEKRTLVALSDGLITSLNIEIGENVNPNEAILTLISQDLSVDVDISESDIAKVSIGDPVEMTLDAFGEDTVFTGTVAEIDPAETEISGVIYYKTHISFLDLPSSTPIKSGMTANVEITTDTRKKALVIPSRAILTIDGIRIVRVLQDKKTAAYEEREVTVGLRGNNGEVEIKKGLRVGEEIITFLKTTE